MITVFLLPTLTTLTTANSTAKHTVLLTTNIVVKKMKVDKNGDHFLLWSAVVPKIAPYSGMEFSFDCICLCSSSKEMNMVIVFRPYT